MWPFKPKELPIVEIPYSPILSSNETGILQIVEQFKGEVEQDKIRFPSELGEKHPFDFILLENLYKKFGFFTAVIDKYVDYIWGAGFFVKSDDDRAQTIIEQFMQDVNFDMAGRQWTKEALMKGNGFLEIGGKKDEVPKGLKVLNAKNMYVDRNKLGEIEGYNQFKGGFKKFDLGQLKKEKKIINFKPEHIAHLPLNVVGDEAYGLGIGYPAMQLMDNFLSMIGDQHFLMKRKANSPLHAKLGKVFDAKNRIIPKPSEVTNFGKQMEVMNKKINWATDDLVDLKVVDFGKIGDKFEKPLEFDLNMLLYAFQVPGVIMGISNINQGIAKAEIDGFDRRIRSIQANVEKVIEEKIFKRVLRANGFVKDAKGTEVHVEFEWGSPSILQVEGRMETMSELIRAPTTGLAMRMMLEDEMIKLFKLDVNEWEKLKLEEQQKEEEERKRLEARPQPIVPGQNAKFPKPVPPKPQLAKQPKAEQSFKPEDMIKSFMDILLKQDEKRNEQMIKQQKEEQNKEEKRHQQQLETIKAQEQPKPEVSIEDIKDEIKKGFKEKHKPKNKRRLLRNKTGLLPSFRVSRETESVKNTKLIVKFKRELTPYEQGKDCPHCTEQFEDINDISEWLGFNYKTYLKHIEIALAAYGFDQIKAVNEIELKAGMLTETQVIELKKVLDNGFKKGQGLKEMAKQVDKKVQLKDLLRMTSEGDIKLGVSGLPILSRSADKRAIAIVRTEVTRMANQGAVEFYKVEGIKQVSWVASFGDRTCPICEGLNGQIFEINNTPDMPQHTMCRCTFSPVVELK